MYGLDMGKKKVGKKKLEKIEWTTVGIPKGISERIQKVIYRLNYKSVSDYVQDAVRRKLENDEWRVKTQEKEESRMD